MMLGFLTSLGIMIQNRGLGRRLGGHRSSVLASRNELGPYAQNTS